MLVKSVIKRVAVVVLTLVVALCAVVSAIALPIPECKNPPCECTTCIPNYMVHYPADGPSGDNSEWAQEMLRQFDLVVKLDLIPADEYMTAIAGQLSAGIGPDVVFPWPKRTTDLWGAEGYLQPLEGVLDRVPNLRHGFDPKEWTFVVDAASAPDGHIYGFPIAKPIDRQGTWIYRKQTFDEIEARFPRDTRELYDAAKMIKDKFPSSWPVQGTVDGSGRRVLPSGFLLAWRTWDDWYLDPDSKELSYGPQTSKYRELMQYLNKLYSEDLVSPDQRWKEWSDIMYLGEGGIGDLNEAAAREGVAGSYVAGEPLAEPNSQPLVRRDGMWYQGASISIGVPEARVNKWLSVLDYFLSEEGSSFTYFGFARMPSDYSVSTKEALGGIHVWARICEEFQSTRNRAGV